MSMGTNNLESNKNNAILNALQEAEQLGIKLVVWKNRNKIEESLGGGFNIDVLVQEKYKARFESVLHGFGFFEADSKHKSFPGVTHYFRLTGGQPLHIHVYFRLVTGESPLKEYDLPLVDFVLEQSSQDKTFGISVVNDQAAAYLFILRHYLKSGSFVGRRSYKLQVLKEKEDFGVNDNILMDIAFAADPLCILPLIKREEIIGAAIPAFVSSLRIKWRLRSYQRNSSIYFIFKRNLPVLLRKLNVPSSQKKRKKIRPSGSVVSMTGADATGKSTIVAEVAKNLGPQFDVVYAHTGKPPVYLATFLSAFVRIVKGLRKNGIGIKNIKHCREPEIASENLSGIGFIHRLINVLRALEVAFSRLVLTKYVTYRASKGSFVITDRWPTMKPGKMDGPRINPNEGLIEYLAFQLEMWMYGKVPTADLAIVLSVPLEVALERNVQREKRGKETSEQVIDRHLNNNDILPKAKKILRYSNNGSLESSSTDVMAKINELLVEFSQPSKIK